jgi:hypothetical protein
VSAGDNTTLYFTSSLIGIFDLRLADHVLDIFFTLEVRINNFTRKKTTFITIVFQVIPGGFRYRQ